VSSYVIQLCPAPLTKVTSYATLCTFSYDPTKPFYDSKDGWILDDGLNAREPPHPLNCGTWLHFLGAASSSFHKDFEWHSKRGGICETKHVPLATMSEDGNPSVLIDETPCRVMPGRSYVSCTFQEPCHLVHLLLHMSKSETNSMPHHQELSLHRQL